jgi:hypothetical protein
MQASQPNPTRIIVCWSRTSSGASDCPPSLAARATTANRAPAAGCHVTLSSPCRRAVARTPAGTAGRAPFRTTVPATGALSPPYTTTKGPLSAVNSTLCSDRVPDPAASSWTSRAATAAGSVFAEARTLCCSVRYTVQKIPVTRTNPRTHTIVLLTSAISTRQACAAAAARYRTQAFGAASTSDHRQGRKNSPRLRSGRRARARWNRLRSAGRQRPGLQSRWAGRRGVKR